MKVSTVRFQTALEFPGVVGQIGNVLPSPNKTLDNLQMAVKEQLVEVKFSYKGIDHVLLVPLTNVVFMRAHPEKEKK